MKGKKLEEMRNLLLKMKEDALEEIKKALKTGADAVSKEPGGDMYDQASNERERELQLLLGDREREKIRNIDEALIRLEEGEYGICEECEEDIPIGRLKAMPFARLCVKCKSDLEKIQSQTRNFDDDKSYREMSGVEEEEEEA
jgi:DnaK suppressor protein